MGQRMFTSVVLYCTLNEAVYCVLYMHVVHVHVLALEARV